MTTPAMMVALCWSVGTLATIAVFKERANDAEFPSAIGCTIMAGAVVTFVVQAITSIPW